ncbi:MAG: TIGR00282 family metallophosphoesterase [Planctomycetota bacterium]
MRVLYLGDVVGTPGRLAVEAGLPLLRAKYKADLAVVNAENAANGTGLTPEQYNKLRDAGADGITLGDHCFKKQQIAATLNRPGEKLIRPANLPDAAAGRGAMALTPNEGNGPTVTVIVVMGRLFMPLPAGDPFETVEAILAETPDDHAVILEVHAEATSEKVALGWRFNGRVAAVVGTHTHVPTADHRILPAGVPGSHQGVAGTAYISDLGMSGPIDSVLGRRVDRVLKHMTTAMPSPFDVADGPAVVSGVLVTLDPRSGRATAIEPVRHTVVDGKLKPAW